METENSALQRALQAFYGTKEDLNDTILDGLRQSSWQALITRINSRSMKTQNGVTTATFVAVVQISESVSAGARYTYAETATFVVIKVGDQWKIEDWTVD